MGVVNITPSRAVSDAIARGLTAAKYAGFYQASVDGKPFHMIRNQYRRGTWDVTISGVHVGHVTEAEPATIHDP